MKVVLRVAALFVSSITIFSAAGGTCYSDEPYKSFSAEQKFAIANIVHCKGILKNLEYIHDGLRRNQATQDPASKPLLDMFETELKQQGARPAPPPKSASSWVEIERSKNGSTTYYLNVKLPNGVTPRLPYHGGSGTKEDLSRIKNDIEDVRGSLRRWEYDAENLGLQKHEWENPKVLGALEKERRKAQNEKDKAGFINDMVKDLPLKSDVKVDWGEETTRVTGEITKGSQDGGLTRKEEMTQESHQAATSPSRSWSSGGSDTSVDWGEETTQVTGEVTKKGEDGSVDWGSETTREADQPTQTTSTSSGTVYPTKFDDRIQWNDLQGNPGTRNQTPWSGYNKPPTYLPNTGTYKEDQWLPVPNRSNMGILPVRPGLPNSPGVRSPGIVRPPTINIDISRYHLPVRPAPFNPLEAPPTRPSGTVRPTNQWGDNIVPEYNPKTGRWEGLPGQPNRTQPPGVRPSRSGQPTNVKGGRTWGSDPYAPLNLQPNRTSSKIGRPTVTVRTTSVKTGRPSWIRYRGRNPHVIRMRKGTVVR